MSLVRNLFFMMDMWCCWESVAGFRPHTAASTSQAAFHALKLNEYLRQGQVDWPSFEDEIMKYARNGVEHGKKLGNRSQFQNIVPSQLIKLIVAMSGGPMADSS
jgi:hypothetical protein